jgi:hypothetical protein
MLIVIAEEIEENSRKTAWEEVATVATCFQRTLLECLAAPSAVKDGVAEERSLSFLGDSAEMSK